MTTPYFIVCDAGELAAATRLASCAYRVITLEQARNGKAAEIAGAPCLILPTKATIDHDRRFGRELAAFAAPGSVKMLNVAASTVFAPSEIPDWTYDQFVEWVTGQAEHSVNVVEILEPPEEIPDNVEIPKKRVKLRAPQNSEPPDALPPLGEADLAMDGSDLPPGSLPDADGQDGSEPDVAAYYSLQGPLSASEAYIPYQTPETRSEWPETPSDWWSEGKVPEMAPDLMPPALRDYICQESETMGVDPGIFALYALGFCAGALSDSHVLQVKPDNPRWVQPARLWLMMIGNSSTKKTPPLAELRGAAWKLEIDMRKASMADEERWIEETKIYEKQTESYISARAKGESRDRPEKPRPPNRERFLVGNSTVESLGDILLSNPRGILNIQDELVSILKGLGQYKSGGNDKEAYLMGFDGGPYPIDRKGRAELIPNFGWSLIGGTQKQKIRDVASALRLESDGFMARFVPYVARVATEDLDRPADQAGYNNFADILHRLWEMQVSDAPVKFSAEAQLVRREFSSWAWNQAKGEWLGESLRSAISKYDTQFGRFCLTYHAIACAADHNAHLAPEISAETARTVARLFRECLYHHAENVYLHILDASSDIMYHVRKVAGKILAKGWKEITPTTLAQGWTGWRKLAAWQRRAVLGILSEGGWIKTGDRRGYVEGVTITYFANPRLRELFPHHTEMEIAYLEDMAERRERMAGED